MMTEYHHGDLKNALIKAARAQLATRGAAALNLRALARSLGVTHPAVYRHFRDKNALLEAVAEQGFSELALKLREHRARAQGQEAQLKALVVAYLGFAEDYPELTRVMFALIPAPAKKRNEQLYAASKDAYAVLTESVAGTQGDSTINSAVVWAMVHGLASLSIEQQLVSLTNPKKRDAVIDKVVSVLSRGLE